MDIDDILSRSLRVYIRPIVLKLELEKRIKVDSSAFAIAFDCRNPVFFNHGVYFAVRSIRTTFDKSLSVDSIVEEYEFKIPLFEATSVIAEFVDIRFEETLPFPEPKTDISNYIRNLILGTLNEVKPVSSRLIELLHKIGISTKPIELNSYIISDKSIITNAHPLAFLSKSEYRSLLIMEPIGDEPMEFNYTSFIDNDNSSDKLLVIGRAMANNGNFIEGDNSDHLVSSKLIDIMG